MFLKIMDQLFVIIFTIFSLRIALCIYLDTELDRLSDVHWVITEALGPLGPPGPLG